MVRIRVDYILEGNAFKVFTGITQSFVPCLVYEDEVSVGRHALDYLLRVVDQTATSRFALAEGILNPLLFSDVPE